MKVTILFGGNSPERDVSIRSASSLEGALKAGGHSVQLLDIRDEPQSYLEQLRNGGVLFPIIHGVGGEDGVLQQLLEQYDVPFVGSGSAASQLCFDKWQFKQKMRQLGIQTPAGEIVTEESFWQSPLHDTPFVLKPVNGGSSIDTIICRESRISSEISDLIHDVFTRHEQLLLEELIEGTECTVPVLLGKSLPVIEIIPPANQEFDYENKYNGVTQELCPPLHISMSMQNQVQKLAEKVHRETECRHFSRTDFIIRSDRVAFILETNTLPGMTTASLFPRAAAAAGMSMSDLCNTLVIAANQDINA